MTNSWFLIVNDSCQSVLLICVRMKTKPLQSSSLTDSVTSDMSSWWPKSTNKDDDNASVTVAPLTQTQNLSVVASGSSQPGSAPPSLPQSPSARRGVNLLDEVVRSTSALRLVALPQLMISVHVQFVS